MLRVRREAECRSCAGSFWSDVNVDGVGGRKCVIMTPRLLPPSSGNMMDAGCKLPT